MVAEIKQECYRGVLCLHCRQPIPLSATVARRVAELRGRDLSPVHELGSHAFTLRCRACEKEGLYAEPNFIDCEGTPRTRTTRPRKAPSLTHPPGDISRAANS